MNRTDGEHDTMFRRLSLWIDERTHLHSVVTFLANKTVPRHRHSHWYFFGGLALFFFMVQLITGMLLLLYYSPTPDTAYESVQFITTQVPFGWLIRSIHSWAANLMIASVLVHFFSVYFMKAYRSPREVMWFSGVVLLMLILGFGFTGYLLPWDTVAYFATQIGTEIPRSTPVVGELIVSVLRGGEYIAEESLKRLFALHIVILPLISILLVSLHLILNQVHGSSVPIGVKTKEPGIPFYPNFMIRDVMAWGAAAAILLAFAILLPVHLGTKANPLASAPLGIKPEWYFLTLYETLRLVPSQILGVNSETLVNLFVMLLGMLLFLVPLIDRKVSVNQPSNVFTWIGMIAIIYIVVAISLAYLT